LGAGPSDVLFSGGRWKKTLSFILEGDVGGKGGKKRESGKATLLSPTRKCLCKKRRADGTGGAAKVPTKGTFAEGEEGREWTESRISGVGWGRERYHERKEAIDGDSSKPTGEQFAVPSRAGQDGREGREKE